MKRLYYLDNLKVCLTVLVIMHHAGQAYGNGGAWAYTPSNPAEFMPWIWHFFSTNAAFFMGLYFFISGYFVPKSFDKQGSKQFVHKKLLRLGVPLLFMGGIISILSGKPEIGHMWFIESLLVFCLVYAVIRHWVSPIEKECSSKPTIIGLLIVALLMGIGSYFIRQVSPQDHWGQSSRPLDLAVWHHPPPYGACTLSTIYHDVRSWHLGLSLPMVRKDE